MNNQNSLDKPTPTNTIDNIEECVFCQRIKNGEFEDKFANHVMFEPLNPVVSGHKLVVPVVHSPNLNDGGIEADQTGWALRYFTNDLDSYNLITSKGKAATQTIQHLHFHIVPRQENDGLTLPWTPVAINKTIMEARIEGSIAENQKRPGYRYLSREIKKERQFIYDQLQNGNMPKLLHAQLDDVYRWFEARLPVAKLIDKDRVDELRQQITKKYGRADNEGA